MGMTEKDSLINTVTLFFCENYGLNIKEVKSNLNNILQNYHITISDERNAGTDLSTEYLLKKFAEGKSATGMEAKTIRQYTIAVNKLEEYSKKQLADCEPEDINSFLISYGKTVSSVTLRAKYQLLSSVYNYLFIHKYIGYNPIIYIDAPKMTVKYKSPMTDYDLEKLKNACEKLPEKESVRDMALLYFFTSTGCRVSEVCNIKIKDVNLVQKICTVTGKGKKQRPVMLTDKAVYRLKLYLNTRSGLCDNSPLFAHIRGKETPITKDGVRVILNKLKKQVGVENVTCHSFRRYYATELRKRNVNIQMIASSLGHANLNQINRYSLYNNSEMLDVIRGAI